MVDGLRRDSWDEGRRADHLRQSELLEKGFLCNAKNYVGLYQDRRLSSLISLMLSSQTKDPVTHEATMNLRRNLQGGLCLEGILSATDEEIHVGIFA